MRLWNLANWLGKMRIILMKIYQIGIYDHWKSLLTFIILVYLFCGWYRLLVYYVTNTITAYFKGFFELAVSQYKAHFARVHRYSTQVKDEYFNRHEFKNFILCVLHTILFYENDHYEKNYHFLYYQISPNNKKIICINCQAVCV